MDRTTRCKRLYSLKSLFDPKIPVACGVSGFYSSNAVYKNIHCSVRSSEHTREHKHVKEYTTGPLVSHYSHLIYMWGGCEKR